MRLIIFVGLLLTCLALTEAQSFRSSQTQESLEKSPILTKESDMVHINEAEAFGQPPREYQDAAPYRPIKPLID